MNLYHLLRIQIFTIRHIFKNNLWRIYLGIFGVMLRVFILLLTFNTLLRTLQLQFASNSSSNPVTHTHNFTYTNKDTHQKSVHDVYL